MNIKDKPSHNRFYDLYNNTTLSITLIGLDGIILETNEATSELFKYKKEDLIGQNFRKLGIISDINIEETNQLFKSILEGKIIQAQKIKINKANGESAIIKAHASIVRFKNKDAIQITAQDITKIEKTNEKYKKVKTYLKRSEKRYKLITENINDLIAILNKDFKYEYINEPITQKIMGYTQSDVIGKSALKYIHPEDRTKAKNLFLKYFKKGEGKGIIRFLHKKEYWVYLEVRGKTFIDIDGNLKGITVSRDITKKKEMEQKLKDINTKLNFYKDLLAHDMANILNNIKTSIQLMKMWKDKQIKPEKREEMMEIISHQIDKGASLISNVRKLAKLDNKKKETISVNLKNILNDSLEQFSSRFQDKDICIKKKFPKGKIIVKGGELLESAFENILLNGYLHNDSDNINFWVLASNIRKKGGEDYAKIEFKDNGIGIKDERKNSIFQRNFKKKGDSGGMGIGLSLVKKIIENYGGEISVQNRVKEDYKKGTNIVILLRKVGNSP